MASIRKRGKSWQVRHHGRSRTFTVKDDAKRYALECERRDQLGSLYEAPPELLGSFLDAYIDRKKKGGLRASTIKNLEAEAQHLRTLRERPIPSLRAADVEDVVLTLGARRRSARALALLKSVLRSARSRGQTIDEAILELKPPRYESREAKFLTLKQLYELSSWMPEWTKRIVTVAGLTGLRQGELFDLLDSDLDLDNAKLEVRHGKTKAARRTVHLSAECVRLLREQLVARPPGTSLIFPTRTGLRHEKSRFMERYFRPARDAAGLHGLTFHHLRHTAISLMALSGWRPEHIAAQVGHVDGGALIHKKYRHLYEQEMEALPAKLDALMEAR